MRIRISAILLFGLCSLSAPCYSQNSAPSLDDLIVWEVQNWKPGGGYRKLTLWRDGYSEIEVAVPSSGTLRKPNPGWEMARIGKLVRYVHRYAYSPKATRTKFAHALRAGIRRLKSFKPSHADGPATRVVISLDGKRHEAVIPEFTAHNKDSLNHRRFLAVAAVLDGFSTNAFDVPGAKPKPPANNAPTDKDPDTKTPDTEKSAAANNDGNATDAEKPTDTTAEAETPANETSTGQ